MNWFYAEAGQQVGPIDEKQFEELVRSGKIQDHTLVWREGMANWQPYREVRPPLPGESPPISGADPGMVAAPLAPAPPSGATEAELLARDYTVEIGECFSRAWQVFKANTGMIIGVSVLVYLAVIAANAIPYLGFILGVIFNGPLFGGLWVFYLKNIRNQPSGIEDGFSSFGPRFWQMVMTALIPFLIALGFFIVLALLTGLTIPAVFMGRRALSGSSSVSPAFFLAIVPVFLAFGCLMAYLNTCWFFALPLVADKGLKFWPAMQLSRKVVSKHWWMTFWLTVVCGLFGGLGILACCVGVLVTGPVAFATSATHYDRVFGDLTPSSAAE